VAASAICTSSGSISFVWFHWLAMRKIASSRAMRPAVALAPAHSFERRAQHRRERSEHLEGLGVLRLGFEMRGQHGAGGRLPLERARAIQPAAAQG